MVIDALMNLDDGKIKDWAKFADDSMSIRPEKHLEVLKNMHSTKRKLVVGLLAGVALVDNKIHSEEHAFLNNVIGILKVSIPNIESIKEELSVQETLQNKPLAAYMGFEGLEQYLNERTNCARIFDALNFSLHTGETVKNYLRKQVFINNKEQKRIIITAFTQIGLLLKTLKDLNTGLRFKDPEMPDVVMILLHPEIKSALKEAIYILKQ